MTERVNHPPHYADTVPNIECIEVTQHFNFNRGNAIKYIWRAGAKEGSDEVEDLKKSIRYLEYEIERLEKIKEKKGEEVRRIVNEFLRGVKADGSFVEAPETPQDDAPEPVQPQYDIPQPDWSKSPEWANWWAVDWNGSAWWFEYEPIENLSWQVWQCRKRGGMVQSAMKGDVMTTQPYRGDDRIRLGTTPWSVVKVQRKGETA